MTGNGASIGQERLSFVACCRLRRGQVGVIFTHHMFCPRCGVALTRAIELCSGCGADLRPLLATGFLNAPVGPAPSDADPRQADAVRWMDRPTAPAVTTFSPDAPEGAAAEGALGIAGAGRAARAVLPLAPEMLDSDVTRLGPSEAPTGAGMDEESTWTPSSPGALRPASNPPNRRRADVARMADEGPLEVGQSLRHSVSHHQIARHWRDGRRLPGVGLGARSRARVQGHSAGRDATIPARPPRSKRASSVSCCSPGR